MEAVTQPHRQVVLETVAWTNARCRALEMAGMTHVRRLALETAAQIHAHRLVLETTALHDRMGVKSKMTG